MLQWKKSRGRQFVFFQSHPGFAFGNENVTKEFYDKIMCKSVGDALHMVVERGQRWKCPTYKEGVMTHPHSQTLSLGVAQDTTEESHLVCLSVRHTVYGIEHSHDCRTEHACVRYIYLTLCCWGLQYEAHLR